MSVDVSLRSKKRISVQYKTLYNISRSEKWGKKIQAAAYNGARTVVIFVLYYEYPSSNSNLEHNLIAMYSPISAIWFIITKKDFINAFAIATLQLTIGAHRLVRFQVWIYHAGLC